MLITACESVENLEEKAEHSGYQQFLLFPQCFSKVRYSTQGSYIHMLSIIPVPQEALKARISLVQFIPILT